MCGVPNGECENHTDTTLGQFHPETQVFSKKVALQNCTGLPTENFYAVRNEIKKSPEQIRDAFSIVSWTSLISVESAERTGQGSRAGMMKWHTPCRVISYRGTRVRQDCGIGRTKNITNPLPTGR